MTAVEQLKNNGIDFDISELSRIAAQYSLTEISVFGSSIRGDIRESSDVDLLVSFSKSAEISLFDIMDLEADFERLFQRPVDIVEQDSLTNPIRRTNILSSKELLYAS